MNEVNTIHAAHRDKLRHKHFFLLLIPSIVFVVVLALLLKDRWKETPSTPNSVQEIKVETHSLKINDTEVGVRIAKTAIEHEKGLSGVTHLDENEGMLFIFPGKVRPAFWMKDMLIPLDFIWITDNKVSQIHKDVPAPVFGTPDQKLKLYIPDDLVSYVLEVNAGFSDKNNIKVGDLVDLSAL